MLVKYWKNFKWFLFIPLILFIFFININKVSAFVFKRTISGAINSNTISGTLTSGNNTAHNITFNDRLLLSNITEDLLVIKFGNFSLKTSTNAQGGTVGSTSSFVCNYYTTSSTGDIACSSGGLTTYDNSTSGNIYIQSALYYNGSTGQYKSTCYMSSELENMLICPIDRNPNYTDISGMEINIRNGGYGLLTYNISVNALRYLFNYEQTEMTVQQNQTNTNLQYIYQYQQNDNVTGSTTQVQGDFSDLAQSFNSELQGVNDLSQLVLMPISLFMDLSTDNCQPLHLQIPYVNMSVDLPCMKAIFNQYFNGLYSIFTTIMSAIICYWVAIKTGALVKEIVDCDNDRIEVVDL